MDAYPVKRKVVTIVQNKWWDEMQEKVREGKEHCDKAINICRGNATESDFDLAMSLDLVESRLVAIRRLLEAIDSPI